MEETCGFAFGSGVEIPHPKMLLGIVYPARVWVSGSATSFWERNTNMIPLLRDKELFQSRSSTGYTFVSFLLRKLTLESRDSILL